MSQTQTRRTTREPLRRSPGVTLDISDEGMGRDGGAHADVNIVRALMFAQGLDERGRRLALSSDFMTEDELRPNHVMATRQSALLLTDDQKAIYRKADRFGDGQPNVHSVTQLTRTARLAVVQASKSESLRFSPKEPPMWLVPADRGRKTEPTTPRFIPATATNLKSGGGASSTDFGAIGSLALAGPLTQSSPGAGEDQANKQDRARLHAVATRQRPWSIYGVAMFWTAFLIVFLFAAVIMHAGLASHQVSLDKMNTDLEQSAALNSRLRVEVASLQSPQRIAERASHLGLQNPDSVSFIKAVPAPVNEPTVSPALPPANTAAPGK
jgi:cell division protein FtsL